jgi:hypothetical protein
MVFALRFMHEIFLTMLPLAPPYLITDFILHEAKK